MRQKDIAPRVPGRGDSSICKGKVSFRSFDLKPYPPPDDDTRVSKVTGLDALRKATTSFDDEPCDQKEGSCLVAGAVESDRDVTGSELFGGTHYF